MRRPLFPLVWILLLSVDRAPAQDKVEFNRDVRPILSDTCFACHGPDKNKRKAKLRLDDRAVAVEKGAIVPGKAAESELVSRIFSADADTVMPPPASHKKLTDRQKEILKKWVEQGAEYQPHWAYMPVRVNPVPATKYATRNEIDSFIFAELERRGILPSPEADKRTLIRRVTLDLTGLPPAPAEVEAFLADDSPTAFEKVVDRLLASPHYGERMATPWLDLVRFADTVGYHGDQNQRIFPYRDFVINSFNANKPFDVFTREQLAGDLLPNPTIEQLVATGFNRLNMMTREGGAQPKEYLAKYQADRVRTLSMTWLGSTMGCCECHDHKYDPFTAKDFYSMSAFFADVRQWGVYNDYNYTPNPDLKGWSNDHPFPPEIEVESPYLKKRVGELWGKLRDLPPNPKGPEFDAWKNGLASFLKTNKSGWATPTPIVGTGATAEPDGRVVISDKPAKGGKQILTLQPGAGWVAAIKLELLPEKGKITRGGGDATTVQLAVARKSQDEKEVKVPLFYGEADRAEVTRYANTEPVLGLLNGWKTSARDVDKPHTAVWLLDQPVRLAHGEQLIVTLTSDNLACARVSLSPFGFLDQKMTAEAGIVLHQFFNGNWDASLQEPEIWLRCGYFFGTGSDKVAFALAKVIEKELFALNSGKAWTQVTVPSTPTPTRVLPRGNWMDETGPVVPPAVPSFLPPIENKDGRRLTRLDLANWVTSKDNPLTARVFVNRLWKQFFGTGLSGVMEDVGAQGEAPSYPELLDWQAAEFARDWDVKKAVRRIVTSAAYRQDSKARPELKDLDPNNRLVAFMSPRRLEAEFVRDNALAAAGLLNRDLGGPSAFPYQPGGYYANLQFPDRNYVANADDRQYRRGLYMHWQRTFLHPMLANFDAPSREECTASRPNANTPQQALTLLNDPTFAEAARVMASDVVTDDHFATDQGRLDWVYRCVLGRGPKPAERETLLKFLAGQREHYRTRPDEAKKRVRVGNAPVPSAKELDPAEHAAWAELCRVVLNLHEAITRY